MSLRRFGGRRTARYPQNATVDGKLAEARFDLNPDPRSVRPAPQEQSKAEFGALSQQDKDSLTGWLVSNVSKAVPRAPWDGSPKTGLLRSADLAQQATQDMGTPITAAMIAGACLDLGFETVTAGDTLADLRICAVWKDS
jgi:hypothetical protein